MTVDKSTQEITMDQSPVRPYSLTTARGKLRIRGGDGDEDQDGQDQGKSGDSGKSGEDSAKSGADGDGVDDRVRDAEERAKKAEQDAKDAKKRADAADKALKDKEREGMEDHQRTEAERDDFKEKYEKLLKIVETSYIDTEIMKLSAAKDKNGQAKYNWHEIESVRALLNKDAIKLDLDTGEVEGLNDQLTSLAKAKPHLLVPQQNDDNNEPPAGPATGSHPYGGTPRQRETDRGKLGVKYKIPGFVGSGSSRPV